MAGVAFVPDHWPMGIRINTRLGKNTSASFPLGGLLLVGFVAVSMVCGLVSAIVTNAWLMVSLLIAVVVVGGVGVLTFWQERRRRER